MDYKNFFFIFFLVVSHYGYSLEKFDSSKDKIVTVINKNEYASYADKIFNINTEKRKAFNERIEQIVGAKDTNIAGIIVSSLFVIQNALNDSNIKKMVSPEEERFLMAIPENRMKIASGIVYPLKNPTGSNIRYQTKKENLKEQLNANSIDLEDYIKLLDAHHYKELLKKRLDSDSDFFSVIYDVSVPEKLRKIKESITDTKSDFAKKELDTLLLQIVTYREIVNEKKFYSEMHDLFNKPLVNLKNEIKKKSETNNEIILQVITNLFQATSKPLKSNFFICNEGWCSLSKFLKNAYKSCYTMLKKNDFKKLLFNFKLDTFEFPELVDGVPIKHIKKSIPSVDSTPKKIFSLSVEEQMKKVGLVDEKKKKKNKKKTSEVVTVAAACSADYYNSGAGPAEEKEENESKEEILLNPHVEKSFFVPQFLHYSTTLKEWFTNPEELIRRYKYQENKPINDPELQKRQTVYQELTKKYKTMGESNPEDSAVQEIITNHSIPFAIDQYALNYVQPYKDKSNFYLSVPLLRKKVGRNDFTAGKFEIIYTQDKSSARKNIFHRLFKEQDKENLLDANLKQTIFNPERNNLEKKLENDESEYSDESEWEGAHQVIIEDQDPLFTKFIDGDTEYYLLKQ